MPRGLLFLRPFSGVIETVLLRGLVLLDLSEGRNRPVTRTVDAGADEGEAVRTPSRILRPEIACAKALTLEIMSEEKVWLVVFLVFSFLPRN